MRAIRHSSDFFKRDALVNMLMMTIILTDLDECIFEIEFNSLKHVWSNHGCNIPAYHSGFSGIITEKHIKLRYYGEGEIIPECFWLRKVNWIAGFAAITGNNSCEVGKLATRDHWLRPVPPPTA